MGEIADDHYVELFWSEGTGIGADGGHAPHCDHPAYGGMNRYIQNHIQIPSNTYRCKFCGESIGFINRKPYNHSDGSAHTCLRNKAMQEAKP